LINVGWWESYCYDFASVPDFCNDCQARQLDQSFAGGANKPTGNFAPLLPALIARFRKIHPHIGIDHKVS
jgi:hypothetical protein